MSSRTKGLTLLEIILTMSLIGILVVPIALFVTELLHGIVRGRDSNMALNLSRDEVERLDALDNFFAPELSVGETQLPNYQGSEFTLVRTVTCEAGNCTSRRLDRQGMKRITVIVRRPASVTPLSSLTTFRTKHVEFGR